jgi:hypothetical protein
MAEIIRQNRYPVADVRFNIEQIPRRAAPLSRMKRHHLHQPPRSDRARSPRIEPRVLSQKHPNQQGRSDVPSSPFFHERRGDPVYKARVPGVPAEHRSNMRLITASWKPSRDRLSKLSRSRTLVQNKVEDLRKSRTFCFDHYGTKRIGLRRKNSDRATLERRRPLSFAQPHRH